MFLKTILFVVFFGMASIADVWINASEDKLAFQDFVVEREEIRISNYYLGIYENKRLEQALLLERISQWSKNNISSAAIEKELRELQAEYVFNSSNRLALFEFFKSRSDFKLLCHIYANDVEIKSSEPFFDASCTLKQVLLKDVNPTYLMYDYLLVDGNKIHIHNSSHIYSTGKSHQMIFISDRFTPQEVNGDLQKIKKSSVVLTSWVEGTCDNFKNKDSGLSTPVRVYFSKACTSELQPSETASWAFIKRNKYTIITSAVLFAAAMYVSSQYQLGVTLP